MFTLNWACANSVLGMCRDNWPCLTLFLTVLIDNYGTNITWTQAQTHWVYTLFAWRCVLEKNWSGQFCQLWAFNAARQVNCQYFHFWFIAVFFFFFHQTGTLCIVELLEKLGPHCLIELGTFRIPTWTGKPGKMGRHYPVRENLTKYWKSQGISDKCYLLFLVIFKLTVYYLLKWIKFLV